MKSLRAGGPSDKEQSLKLVIPAPGSFVMFHLDLQGFEIFNFTQMQ